MNESTEIEIPEQYLKQLDTMLANGQKWTKLHPDKIAYIQFKTPPGVGVIVSVSQAVKQGFIVANNDGVELLQAMWPWDDVNEPTLIMVKIVIDHMNE